MDFLKVNDNDFSELLIDLSDLRNMYINKEDYYDTDFGLNSLNIGNYNLRTKRLGNIYFTTTSAFFNKNIIIEGTANINTITLYFIVKGGALFDSKLKNGNILKSHTHNLLFMNENYKGKGGYFKNIFQETIGIHIPINYFENLVNYYPEIFESYFVRYQKGESFYLQNNYISTTHQMYSILAQIEQNYLLGNNNLLYLDAKILELLSLLFVPNVNKNICTYNCCKTISEIDKIKEAAHILLSDISNPPTIKELSLKVGINEKKLKYGFKEVFGTTVFGYLFEYKMNKAHKLLLNTDKNITEIADICGYEYLSHFCTAFKRRYGINPKKIKNTQLMR